MNLTKSNDIKKRLKKNDISELRLAYALNVNRSTVTNKLQLPLSKQTYRRMLKAITSIISDRKDVK